MFARAVFERAVFERAVFERAVFERAVFKKHKKAGRCPAFSFTRHQRTA
ncbi:MAG: pentapeptide repeat-containing protein [Permianibacter sp.]